MDIWDLDAWNAGRLESRYLEVLTSGNGWSFERDIGTTGCALHRACVAAHVRQVDALFADDELGKGLSWVQPFKSVAIQPCWKAAVAF